jgi:predicted AAA+ superfamily ATPase
VDLLEHDTFLRFAREPGRFRREAEARIAGGARTIFVDEIQKLPELLDEVHALIERTQTRFLLTGSSARKLRRGAANLLGGRAAIRHLHPLVAAELAGDFDLDRVLRFGSLPPVASSDDTDARELLVSYAETYLREEVQAEALVRNLGGFVRFLDVAAAQSGDLLNFTAVGRDAALTARTVQEYFQILEDTLVGFRLLPWRRSERARLSAHPKFYLFDIGVLNALCRRLTAIVDPSLRGRLFEHLVVLETMRMIDYTSSEARLYYWRTNNGAEVDLLLELHGELVAAIEIKAKSTVAGGDLSGLRAFAAHHPKPRKVVVCLAPEPYALESASVLPYRNYFEQLPGMLNDPG